MTIYQDIANHLSGKDTLPKNKVIADEIFATLTPDRYEEIVKELLPAAVAATITRTRRPMANETTSVKVRTEHQPSGWVKTIQENARTKVLDQYYPDANGVRKKLGLFSAEDVRCLINRIKDKRETLERQEVRFTALLETMRDTHADRVADLSDEALAKAIST